MDIEKAILAIYTSLKEWDNQNQKAIASDGDLLISQYISRFNKNLKACKLSVPSSVRDNFSCGLCRMLNTAEPSVNALLPYLLTAYVVNFNRNRFVSTFLEKVQKSSDTWTDEELMGLTIHESRNNRSNRSNSFAVGIGRLFVGGGQNKEDTFDKKLHILANRFRLDGQEMVLTSVGWPPEYYLIPQRGSATFFRKLKAHKTIMDFDGEKIKGYREAKPGMEVANLCNCDFICDLFAIWYSSIYEVLLEKRKAERNIYMPNAHACICCIRDIMGFNSLFMGQMSDYFEKNIESGKYNDQIHKDILNHYEVLKS